MALETEMVYMYPKENSKPHKTKNYELIHDEENPVPVLRRGLKFTMALRFANRSFDENKDSVKVLFNYGPNPNRIRGTQGVVKVEPKVKQKIDEKQKFWFANVLDLAEDAVTLEVFSPPSIPIGLWSIQVESSILNSTDAPNVFDYENDLYFICNPWNCHDMVYMPEERLLEEYVLTDVGKIWVGPVGSSKGREWIFGQFDACVLPAVWMMFEKSQLDYSSRGDPIKITRMISKMVNSNDEDGGILNGRWDGEYEDGTAPSAWTGSVAILEKYLETQSQVNYGQCWVFSGVVTTICRAIGIPSRVISNLVSAHDADGTLTVDKYVSEDNEEIDSTDSIWNYHVWNDVYMARPDLPAGYGGWQAIDATPQETSDSVFQCGPASLEAVKKGEVGLSYDVGFIIASVNADLMRWKIDHSCELGFSKISCNKYHIGRFVLTKKPLIYDFNGDKDRDDITCFYKAAEGTRTERLALLNAVRGTEMAKKFYEMPEPEKEDVEFELKDLDKINIGEDFRMTVIMNNKSNQERHVKCALSATSVYYNGVKAKLITKKDGELILAPQSKKVLEVIVTADEYLDKLVEYCIMKMYAIATVSETRQTWADEDDFQVITPNIEIEVPEQVPVNQMSMVKLRFRNPLKKVLTKCKLNMGGPTLVRNQVISHPDVRPQQMVELDVGIKPQVRGERKLIVTFSSQQLTNITGSAKVNVV